MAQSLNSSLRNSPRLGLAVRPPNPSATESHYLLDILTSRAKDSAQLAVCLEPADKCSSHFPETPRLASYASHHSVEVPSNRSSISRKPRAPHRHCPALQNADIFSSLRPTELPPLWGTFRDNSFRWPGHWGPERAWFGPSHICSIPQPA